MDIYVCFALSVNPSLCKLTAGFINAVGVFQTYYEQNQLSDYSAFQIGWISSFLVFSMNLGVTYNLLYSLFQGVIVGPLFDIFGPHWLLIVGTITTTFGLMMTSLCHEYYQFFLAQGVVTGLGLSLMYLHLPSYLTSVSKQAYYALTPGFSRNAGWQWAL